MRARLSAGIWLLGAGLMALGCTLRIGALEGTEETPSVVNSEPGGPDEPLLDAVQEARKAEADLYTAQVIYKGGTVVASLQMPSGDGIDFVARETLPALPYALPALPADLAGAVLPPGVQVGLSEWEQIPEFFSLVATAAPFMRPSFWPYILGEAPDAVSIEDYLARYSVGGAPSGVDRLYAGLASKEPNRGVSGFVSQFRPQVDPKSFSLIELTVFCPAEGPVQEQVGIVISVDRKNSFGNNRLKYQDGEPRMHIEYARNVNGAVQYVWDGMDGYFWDNPFRKHQPGEKVPYSLLNQKPIEHMMAIFQAPTGDWWIAFNGDLLGFYSAGRFTMLNQNGCATAWYAEVYNEFPGKANFSQMGSGMFADAGLMKAAHIRNPRFYDMLWFTIEAKDGVFMIPNNPLCYTKSPLTHFGAPLDSNFLFLGGSGSTNPGCTWL